MKDEFAVVKCTRRECGRHTYAKTTQKTRKCPYCNRQINVINATVKNVDTSTIARAYVSTLNQRLGEKTSPSWMKKKNKK
ncbi:MAG: DUF1922 domain-containing protein [Candidatus Kariarchaeaceae archaeon]